MTSRTSSSRSPWWILIVVVALVAAVLLTLLLTQPDRSAPSGGPLPAATDMGAVELRVDNLDAVAAYYRDGVGLEEISRDDNTVVLGSQERELLQLTRTDAPAREPGTAGLYHAALVFEDEADLAQAIERVATAYPDLYQGSADHLVSRAFYFGDPEGNGVELYHDRPREEWEWKNGEVTMGSVALDTGGFVQQYREGSGSGVIHMGHVHLSVGDLDAAEKFYADTVGFDLTSRAPGALFYAAGGYHHHLATNVWNSEGAGQRPIALGLARLTVRLPEDAALDALAQRLTAAGTEFTRTDAAITVDDPWGNTVTVIRG